MSYRFVAMALCCSSACAMVEDFRDSDEDAWYYDQRRQRHQLENEHLTYLREQRGLITSSITDTIRVMPGLRQPARTPDHFKNRTFLDFQTYSVVWDKNSIFVDTPSEPNVARSKDFRRDLYEVRLTTQQNLGRKWLNLELSLPWHFYDLDIDAGSPSDNQAGQPDVDLVFSLVRERFHNLTMQLGCSVGEELLFKTRENIYGGGGWGAHLGFRHSFSTGRFLYQASLDGTYYWEGESDIDDAGDDLRLSYERYKIAAMVGGSYRFTRQLRSGVTAQLRYDRWQDISDASGEEDYGDVETLSIPVRAFVEWTPTLRWSLQCNVGINPFEPDDHDGGGSDIIFGATVGGNF